MVDENKNEENNDEDFQEKYNELLSEINSKDEELSKVKEDLEKQNKKNDEYFSQLQRLQADFENFKKMNDKQRNELIKFANENIIKEILDGYEDFERVLNNSNEYKTLRSGVELIHDKFRDILAKERIEEIPTNCEKFDPFKHEALMVEANDDVENGYIIEELMKGYTYKDKVLKYSKVRVCKK